VAMTCHIQAKLGGEEPQPRCPPPPLLSVTLARNAQRRLIIRTGLGDIMAQRRKLFWALILLSYAAATPALAMSCSRSIPAPTALDCSAEDIKYGANGCSVADCSIESNGWEVDWPPLCSGIELMLHKVFGWPRNTEPRPGDYVAE